MKYLRSLLMSLFRCRHHKYKIDYQITKGNYTLVDVTFEGCPNGRKFILYYKMNSHKLKPHFGGLDAPIARFSPTGLGWHLGTELLELLK